MFASLLLVGGVAVASYTFAIVMQAAVANQLAWRKRKQKRIDKLRDHVIVCGFGRMGQTVCRELQEARAKTSCSCAPASSARRVIVAAAGGGNLVITLSSRVLAPEITIVARAEGNEEVRKLHRAGADRTVSPYHTGGVEIAAAITRPLVAEFLATSRVAGSEVVLAEVEVREGSPLVGRTIGEYGKSEADRICFVAHEQASGTSRIPPRGKDVFSQGDRLVVAGDPAQVAKMQALGHAKVRAACGAAPWLSVGSPRGKPATAPRARRATPSRPRGRPARPRPSPPVPIPRGGPRLVELPVRILGAQIRGVSREVGVSGAEVA